MKNIIFLLSFISFYSFATTAINISNEDLYIESNKIEILDDTVKNTSDIEQMAVFEITNNFTFSSLLKNVCQKCLGIHYLLSRVDFPAPEHPITRHSIHCELIRFYIQAMIK